MRKKFTARIARGEMTFLAAAICTALRATAADTGADTLEAVTVTAERRSESIQEVPLSVTATCCQEPDASTPTRSTICSPLPLLMANRTVVPELGERNRYWLGAPPCVVLTLPKSKMRCQLAPPFQ